MDAIGLGKIGRSSGLLREIQRAIPEREIVGELQERAEDHVERGARRAELLLFDVGELGVELFPDGERLLGLEHHPDGLRFPATVSSFGVLDLEHARRLHARLVAIDETREERDGLGVVRREGQRANARVERGLGLIEMIEVHAGELDLAARRDPRLRRHRGSAP